MRYAVLAIIALLLSLIQYSWLSQWPLAPDLPLALAAWAMVDGTEDGVLLRAWVVGAISDLIDPGSEYFHALAYVILALGYLPLRNLVFRTRFTGWASWAAASSLILSLVDGWMTAPGDVTWKTAFFSACNTAAATMFIGWLFGGLPGAWQPVGRGGA